MRQAGGRPWADKGLSPALGCWFEINQGYVRAGGPAGRVGSGLGSLSQGEVGFCPRLTCVCDGGAGSPPLRPSLPKTFGQEINIEWQES